jgi:hypothetical protein
MRNRVPFIEHLPNALQKKKQPVTQHDPTENTLQRAFPASHPPIPRLQNAPRTLTQLGVSL